jgi:hypothetical protein
MAGNVPMAIMPPFITNEGSKRSEKFEGRIQRDEHGVCSFRTEG